MARLLAHFIDKTGNPVIDGKFLDPRQFTDGITTFASPETGRVGLLDRNGKRVLEPTYDYIETFVDGVAPANVGGAFINGAVRGGRWGLLAADGTLLCEPVYDAMLIPDSGRVTVRSGDKLGFLDLSGAVVVEPRYEYLSWHQEGLAVFFADGADGYLDVDGKVVIAPRFHEGGVFKDGFAKVKRDNLWGVIDRQGRQVHECIYEKLGALVKGACWAVRNGQVFVLAADGTVLGGDAVDEAKQVDEDGIWPVRKGESWGLLRPDGSIVGMGFQNALAFTGGLARVRQNDAWGFANAEGEIVIPCRYEDAWPMNEGRAAVKNELGWTFVDDEGQEHGPGGFAGGNKYVDGLAPVQVDGRWGYLDLAGKEVIAPRFDWVGYFDDGVAIAFEADRGKLATAGAPDGVHTLPEGGLGHPVFEGAGNDAHIIAIVGFEIDLDNSQQELLRKIVLWWERSCHPNGKLYTEDKWLTPFNLYVRVQNLADPVAAVSLLVDQIREAGLPVTETLYARWGWPPDDKVMRPNADPRMGPTEGYFEDFPDYWNAVWSDDGPTPAPENYFYLKGALQDQNGNLTIEERHMPLWMPDIKICMGALQNQGEEYLEPNEASDRVHEVLEARLHERFARVWIKPGTERRYPFPMVREGDDGVEPIEFEGRTGYSFAFQCGVLLHWFSSPRMRFREPELMEALRATILELDLEPVIMWQRFQQQLPMLPMGRPTVLVVNLWDKQA